LLPATHPGLLQFFADNVKIMYVQGDDVLAHPAAFNPAAACWRRMSKAECCYAYAPWIDLARVSRPAGQALAGG
jgi:hypothetical protein